MIHLPETSRFGQEPADSFVGTGVQSHTNRITLSCTGALVRPRPAAENVLAAMALCLVSLLFGMNSGVPLHSQSQPAVSQKACPLTPRLERKTAALPFHHAYVCCPPIPRRLGFSERAFYSVWYLKRCFRLYIKATNKMKHKQYNFLSTYSFVLFLFVRFFPFFFLMICETVFCIFIPPSEDMNSVSQFLFFSHL